MLVGKNIYKNYGEVSVLKDVDIEIAESEVVSIVGASGAGKSTLLQILGTLEKPDSGIVTLFDSDYTTLNNNDLSKLRNEKIGFVFQFHNLMAELTAIENICLPAWIGGEDKTESKTNAENLLDLMGLSHRKSHYPSEMSGGEQQRVAVARALINKPSYVLADEPSGNLDTKNADELHQLFFDVRKQLGCSFVIVTHNAKFADLADRKLVIEDGRFV
ncbi:MAG: lipoprotein-releasing system ATP-binding protein [Spirosomataceae bacterium]|jgi:lipoprotein-releasing system ATP-binding protein